MVEITKLEEKCYARLHSGCSVLCHIEPACGAGCPFYKPAGCEDWVRIEKGGRIWIMPFEEYALYADGKAPSTK